NTRQAGQHPLPYQPQKHPTTKITPIKQLPSRTFPLTTHYLQHPKQIQIKLPHPPKPPQPPQLPPSKLYPSIP
ncbi:glutamate synthase-related protein, partial [Staphylococcus pasteuri]|uniref:glutamate synthase-related protein n=1 Tax=Staphylococcus pasteuri TaxID=45972 RepID=UPI001C9944EB